MVVFGTNSRVGKMSGILSKIVFVVRCIQVSTSPLSKADYWLSVKLEIQMLEPGEKYVLKHWIKWLSIVTEIVICPFLSIKSACISCTLTSEFVFLLNTSPYTTKTSPLNFSLFLFCTEVNDWSFHNSIYFKPIEEANILGYIK